MHNVMTVSFKWNAVVLQFLHHVEAHTLLFSVIFQHGPCNFAHTSATWKIQTQQIFLKESRGTAAKASAISCSISSVVALDQQVPFLSQPYKSNSCGVG
jgi:hypothetical protein